MRRVGFFILSLVIMLQGCKTPKHLALPDQNKTSTLSISESQDFYQNLTPAFKFAADSVLRFSGKGFLTLQGKNQQEVDVQIRMKNSQEIWMSVTAFLGTEVGRLYIHENKIEVLNRLDQTYHVAPLIEFNSQVLGLNFQQTLNVGRIQSILLGQPILFPNPIIPFKVSGNDYELKWENEAMDNSLIQTMDSQKSLLSLFQYQANFEEGFVDLKSLYQYAENSSKQGNWQNSPDKITLSLKTEKLDFILTLEIKKKDWMADHEFAFGIPSQYKIMNLIN